jgi:hypothetical protein
MVVLEVALRHEPGDLELDPVSESAHGKASLVGGRVCLKNRPRVS